MKTQFQLLLDSDLKERLESLKKQTGIPIARFINDMVRGNISELESKYETINNSGAGTNKSSLVRLRKKR